MLLGPLRPADGLSVPYLQHLCFTKARPPPSLDVMCIAGIVHRRRGRHPGNIVTVFNCLLLLPLSLLWVASSLVGHPWREPQEAFGEYPTAPSMPLIAGGRRHISCALIYLYITSAPMHEQFIYSVGVNAYYPSLSLLDTCRRCQTTGNISTPHRWLCIC